MLDWFHVAMRFEHALRAARGLVNRLGGDSSELLKTLESSKWLLWHGRAGGAIRRLRTVHRHTKRVSHKILRKTVATLIRYLRNNRYWLIDYGARYRAGLPISSSTAESTVNCVIGQRFVGRGHMRWSPRSAHLLLQIRCALLNGQYIEHFDRWFAKPPVANDDQFERAA
jgi:hypothetical protein